MDRARSLSVLVLVEVVEHATAQQLAQLERGRAQAVIPLRSIYMNAEGSAQQAVCNLSLSNRVSD